MPSPDPYRAAIARTHDQFTARARLYRNLVIAVSALGLATVGVALWWRSPGVLSLLLLLAPLCGTFFLADRCSLNRWRRQILADWGAGALELRALTGALTAHPAWPRATLAGMLASLPGGGRPEGERDMSGATRQSMAAGIAATDADDLNTLAIKTAGWAIVAASCAVGIIAHFGPAFLGLLAVMPLPVLRMIAKRRNP